MSKERARRREAREHEAAIIRAARAREAEKRERRAARSRALTGWVPKRHSRQTGVLAERRRKQASITIALVVALNVLVFGVLRRLVRPRDGAGREPAGRTRPAHHAVPPMKGLFRE